MAAFTRKIFVVFVLSAAVFTALAAPDAAAETTVRISIGSAEGSNGETVTVPVAVENSPKASTILFAITYDAQVLELMGVGEGSALDLDQQLFTSTPTPGTVAVTAYGSGKPVADGELCLADFRIKTAASGAAPLAGNQPSAASTTNTSIPVSIAGGEVFVNCAGLGPDTPAGVTASTDNARGVVVSWLAAAGAYEYRVYRAKTAQPENVLAVSGWLQGATSYTDTTAVAPGTIITVAPTGCSGVTPSYAYTDYYYWVRARSEAGCPSDYSLPAQGHRAASAKSATAIPPLRADAAVLAGVAALLAAGAFSAKRRSGKPTPRSGNTG